MELVYLWVEEYKNIHHQGFNFSPRFTCQYNEATQELSITKNEEHVSIFPPNINITAIVGENGSGKSSILEFLYKKIERKNYIAVVKYEDSLYYDSNLTIITLIKKSMLKNMFTYFTYSNEEITTDNKILLDKLNIAKMITYNYIEKNYFTLSTFMFFPTKMEIQSVDFKEKLYEFIADYEYSYNKGLGYPGYSEEQINELSNIDDFFHLFLMYKQGVTANINLLLDKNRLINIEQITEKEFLKYFLETKTITLDIIKMTEKEKIIYLNNSEFFEFDFIDEKDRRYNNLSHGERTFFGQLINIFYHAMTYDKNNLFYFFDEPEISLHPNWQKSYIKELYALVEKLGKSYHFVFASHSPFLLSDLPKENVIFLEKYKKNEDENQKEGNCKNVTSEINIETFGANIHTLLSHGFFMKDGLMGEFAKGKITAIKDFYEKVKNSKNPKNEHKQEFENNIENFKHIQSIIGEPFLKTIMKNYLDELELIFSDDENLINKELEALEKRKLHLEKLKNAKN